MDEVQALRHDYLEALRGRLGGEAPPFRNVRGDRCLRYSIRGSGLLFQVVVLKESERAEFRLNNPDAQPKDFWQRLLRYQEQIEASFEGDLRWHVAPGGRASVCLDRAVAGYGRAWNWVEAHRSIEAALRGLIRALDAPLAEICCVLPEELCRYAR